MNAPTPPLRSLVACGACKRQYDATGLAAGSRFYCLCGESVRVPEFRPHASAVVRCSSCGAARETDGPHCSFCRADFTVHERDLGTTCPSCMTLLGRKARYCHHCATPILPQGHAGEPSERACPACGPGRRLTGRTLPELGLPLLECPGCGGVWLGNETLRRLLERARETALPPDLAERDRPAGDPASRRSVVYRRCPACDRPMLRRNFGKRSGVIVDVCREDGTWFDAAELGRVLAWIRSGGERRAEEREREAKRTGSRAPKGGALGNAEWNGLAEESGSPRLLTLFLDLARIVGGR